MAKFPNKIIHLLIILMCSLELMCSCDNKGLYSRSDKVSDESETAQTESTNQENIPINSTSQEEYIPSEGEGYDNDMSLQASSSNDAEANNSTVNHINNSLTSPEELNSDGPLKRALVIGIGHYQDETWSDIHGDKDVSLVVNMLSKNGYKDIKTLVNEQATKKKIVKEFSALKSRCNKGDVVYIHFSGHGQQITDLNGDEKDEKDNLDEAWIPYDAQYAYSHDYQGENHLVDDEIGIYLSELSDKLGSEGKLLVVVDACHSGGSVKGSALDDLRNNPDIYIRGADDIFEIPVSEMSDITKTNNNSSQPKIKEKWLTLTACKDFEVNFEVKTQDGYYGMLTYALCYNYDKFKSMDNKGIGKIIQDFIDVKCPTFLPQNHQLSGVINKINLSEFF